MAGLVPMPRYWPNLKGLVAPEVEQTLHLLYNGINDHESAILNLNGKVEVNAAAATTTTTNTTTTVTAGTKLGGVNNQTGTFYLLAPTDNGGIVTLSNAAPVAVTLNNGLATPFACSIENLGAGLVTLTPSSGLVNGVAAITLTTNQGCFLFYSGVNWFAFTSPQAAQTFAIIAHRFLTSYDAVTGLFTSAQPAFTDVSGTATAAQVPALSALTGQITTAQLPVSGLSITITTAALTALGTQGSMTFTNGILTAQTPAT